MKATLPLFTLALLLAGCGSPTPDAGNATNATTPAPATPAPPPAATPSVDLSRFENKYPSDKVDGVDFLHAPVVTAAIDGSGAPEDVRRFIRAGDGPQIPITRSGDTLTAHGCEAHNCDAHDWAVLIHQDGSGAEVCHHDQDAGGAPEWYAGGKRENKSEGCG
ncbi:hypothetical protein SAMN05192583_1955 [Sphingomonas gellani]|uniref:Inhibitor of vertebrate lysozyme (Ivy) n=1 Tax=Sphingomonas gellani TaxID=1166340 RepID=A0A1H8DK41_9SPHN|nr:hypothetical protein [Sphingomonas gellani]SEN07525.1 hypothetical protein SAMN05192583_1955 [Sphingomonas gellani]